jgi:glyoxylase-like metal-dependent hydrolase (beta-lactamase superfamily II)
MTITRRRIIAGAAAGAALTTLGGLPRRVWAETTLDLGGTQVTTLSDGNLVLPGDFILGPMPQDEAAEILARYGLSTDELTPPCNVTLMRDGTNTVLFDTGAGPSFQASAGQLPDALDAIGLDPADVTHVVFTHAHPDHIWGVLDDFDEPLFYNARHLIGRVERDYWMDPATVDTIGAERQSFAVGAQRRIETLGDALETFEDGAELLAGLTARASYGHTPGHMAFEIAAGGAAAMVVGDAIGNHHVAFERPAWPSGSDQDAETAAATRVALLDRLAAQEMPLIGFHLPGGGIGRAERAGDGYRYVQAG